jgi:hypothetical protein
MMGLLKKQKAFGVWEVLELNASSELLRNQSRE